MKEKPQSKSVALRRIWNIRICTKKCRIFSDIFIKNIKKTNNIPKITEKVFNIEF